MLMPEAHVVFFPSQDSTGLSYIDENFRYYSSRDPSNPRASSPTDAHDGAPLVANAANMAEGGRMRDLGMLPFPNILLSRRR